MRSARTSSPQARYTLKGLLVRGMHLALVLACCVNVLCVLNRTLTPGRKVLAALGTASLVLLVLKRDQFLPIPN